MKNNSFFCFCESALEVRDDVQLDGADLSAHPEAIFEQG